MYKNNINVIGKIILSMILALIFIIIAIVSIQATLGIVKEIAELIGVSDTDIYLSIFIIIIFFGITGLNYKYLFKENK